MRFGVAKSETTRKYHVFDEEKPDYGWSMSLCGTCPWENIGPVTDAGETNQSALDLMVINDNNYCQRCLQLLVKRIIREENYGNTVRRSKSKKH